MQFKNKISQILQTTRVGCQFLQSEAEYLSKKPQPQTSFSMKTDNSFKNINIFQRTTKRKKNRS
jgi:hypothetical protein